MTEIRSARKGTAQTALWQGFAGSLMLMVGSFGVGWMANSSTLMRTPLFIAARTTPASVIACTVILCIGAILMMRAWLRLYQHLKPWEDSCKPILRKALLLWSAPMMVALPLFSRDSYAYIGQGRLMQQGLDPYTNGISSLSNYFSWGPDTMWTEAPTPYGPLWLWVEQGAVWFAQGNLELTLLPFRLASLAGVLLLAFYVPRLAQTHGYNPHRAMWLVVLNPVTLMNFIASVHNDSLMMGLVAAGLYYASRKSNRLVVLGILLVTASVAIKPITLIALPFVGLLWAGANAGWLRKFVYWGATLAISMGALALMGVINGLGFGWLAALQTPGTVWHWYAPIGIGSVSSGWLVDALGGDGNVVANTIQKIAQVISILLVIALAFVKIKPSAHDAAAAGVSEEGWFSRTVMRRMAWAFTAVVLLAPMIQPWYVVWLLVFFAVTGIKDGPHLRLVFYVSVFFVLIALTDQLSVFQWIPLSVVRSVAVGCGLAGLFYLLFCDKKIKGMFRPHKSLVDL